MKIKIVKHWFLLFLSLAILIIAGIVLRNQQSQYFRDKKGKTIHIFNDGPQDSNYVEPDPRN